MLKKFDEWNYRGATKKDQTEIKKWLKRDISLSIDDIGGVHTEEGVYIANAVYDAENGVGIEIQNESWGGKRQNAGRPATGAKPIRAFRLSDEEYEKVKEYIKNLRSENKMTNEFIAKVIRQGVVDTAKYRYIYTTDNTGEYINRLDIDKLDTTAAYDGWKTVWSKK